MDTHCHYVSPLQSRYASSEMLSIFSENNKYKIWRKLWIILAKSEKELGLNITQEQIQELEDHLDEIDYENVAHHEKKMHHDVMAHLHAYGDLCPKSKPILHLGATSAFVTDNGDLIQMQEALLLIEKKLKKLLLALKSLADKTKAIPCLAFTHFQPASPTTVGKRASLWLQDFYMDFQDLKYRLQTLSFLGLKGASGTQASFLTLFSGNALKVKELEAKIARTLSFKTIFPVSGQTYTRKQDAQIINVLSGIAVSAHKCSTDIRLLAHLKEIEEPFETSQVGSSAMPHKRNPILSERVSSLSKFLLSLNDCPSYTAATQWLERSLDDSANRRMVIPEAFLTCDAILSLMIDVISGLQVNSKVIALNLEKELPFLLTEDILMESVKKGGDRQKIHEKLRIHSLESANRVKEDGKSNDLFERIQNDPEFNLSDTELKQLANPMRLCGRAEEQVKEFLESLEF